MQIEAVVFPDYFYWISRFIVLAIVLRASCLRQVYNLRRLLSKLSAKCVKITVWREDILEILLSKYIDANCFVYFPCRIHDALHTHRDAYKYSCHEIDAHLSLSHSLWRYKPTRPIRRVCIFMLNENILALRWGKICIVIQY